MSQLRLGIRSDGTRHVVELEPARAPIAGQGGTVLGWMLVSRVTPVLRTPAELRSAERRRVREAGG